MKVIKYYLVDSENVNDNWLMLFDLAEMTDRIIVFYTQKSPHMSYPSLVKLINSSYDIRFEECFEGTNALDFQLVSYLGYLMKNDELGDSEYIIMSNDNGFDAAVNFWKKRGFPVNKINVNYCKMRIFQKTKTLEVLAEKKKSEETKLIETSADAVRLIAEKAIVKEAVEEISSGDNTEAKESEKPAAQQEESKEAVINADEAVTKAVDIISETPDENEAKEEITAKEHKETSAEQETSVNEGAAAIKAASERKTKDKTGDAAEISNEIKAADSEASKKGLTELEKKEVDTVINCLSDMTVTWLYQALRHIYGEKEGSEIYKGLKNGSYTYDKKKYAHKSKIKYMVKIIFKHSDLEAPKDFVDFLELNKDLETAGQQKAALANAYGKADGDRYYKLFKPHFKMISAMN